MTPDMVRKIAEVPIPEGMNGSITLHCHEGEVQKVEMKVIHSMPKRPPVRKIVKI